MQRLVARSSRNLTATAAFRTASVSRTYASVTEGHGHAFKQAREGVKAHAGETAQLWRKLSWYVALPLILVTTIHAKNLADEHAAHMAHEGEKEKPPLMAYQDVHRKDFPWGSGKTTVFFNRDVNRSRALEEEEE